MPHQARVPPFRPRPARLRLTRALQVALFACLAGPAGAQDPPAANADQRVDAVTLDTIQVTAPIVKNTGTATKTDTPLIEIPQSISVITDRQMRDRGVHGVEEALWYTAGTQGGQYGDDSRSDWTLIRGFRPARYLDGLAMVDGAWTGDSRIEPYGLERIDVLKGPASVNYGAMPPGGMLNFVSKRPTADPLREVEVQVGSYDLRQAAFDLSGPLNDSGTLLYRLTGLARNSDNIVEHVHDDRYYFAPAITWTPDERNSLTVLARWQKADTVEGGGFLPAEGSLYPGPNGTIPRSFFAGEPGGNDYIKTNQSLGYEFSHDFGGGTRFRQNLSYMRADVDATAGGIGAFGLQDDFIPGSDPGRTLLTRYYYPRLDESSSFAVDNSLAFAFDTGRVRHDMLAGLDYRRSRDDIAQAFLFGAPSLDIYNPVYGAGLTVPDFTSHTQQTQGQVGLYVQDQAKFDRWVFTFGGRHDWVGTDTRDRIGGGRQHQSDERFAGRVGVNYLFDNGLAPYVGYSQSFQPTVGTDFDGRAFVPTTGEQVEAGLKYQPARGDLLATLAVFELTQQNTLTVDPDHTLFSVQQGETRVRGVELEGRWNLGPGFSVYGAYTHTDSEVTRSTALDTLGKQLALQPRNQASLGTDYTITTGLLAGLGFAAGVRYTGGLYGDINNLWHTPSYTLYDAAVHYDFGHWRLQLNAANLSDEKYIAVCNSGTWCYYGYPRTVTATARFQW